MLLANENYINIHSNTNKEKLMLKHKIIFLILSILSCLNIVAAQNKAIAFTIDDLPLNGP
jgi:hypothetical protein